MEKHYVIEVERPEDRFETENLTREAFWNLYAPGCVEHYVLHQYREREDFVPELNLCMKMDGVIVAHVMYARSEIQLDAGGVMPIMTFGPLSVAPQLQRRGLGSALLAESMERARQLGCKALAITGNIQFYGTLGFVVASAKGVHYYAEPRENDVPYFLIKELEPGALDGVSGTYRDPDGYKFDIADANAFDALFPPKKKEKLPTQIFDYEKLN